MDAHGAYYLAVLVGAVVIAAACIVARRRPGRVALGISRAMGVVLAITAAVFFAQPLMVGAFSLRTSLPLQLCDVAAVAATVTCFVPHWQLGFELTYFWGLAGTIQGVATPDLAARFPQLEFFVFTVAHVGIVGAALFLAIGLRLRPRRFAPAWVFGITLAVTAVDGVVDWATGANYMYLAHIPASASLLSVLGPWPIYIVSAAGVAVVLFAALDVPFLLRRRSAAGHVAAAEAAASRMT